MGDTQAIPFDEPQFKVIRRSETIGKLVEALAKAQLDFQPIKRDKINPQFHSKYADLDSVISATQKPLANNQLVIMQLPHTRDKSTVVTSMIAHSSGEFIEVDLELPSDMRGVVTAQTVASAVTYARRIGYQGLAGVTGELDDDGNNAVTGSKEAAQNVAQKKIEDLKGKTGATTAAKITQPPKADFTGTLAASIAQTTPDRVMGLIKSVTRLKSAATKREYRRVDMIDHTDAEASFSCCVNHSYPDGSTFFGLLDLIGDTMKETKRTVAATFIVKRSEKGATIERPILLGDISFDSDGVPEIQRSEAEQTAFAD